MVFFSHHDQHFILTKILKKNFIETTFRSRHDVHINFNEIRYVDDIFNVTIHFSYLNNRTEDNFRIISCNMVT